MSYKYYVLRPGLGSIQLELSIPIHCNSFYSVPIQFLSIQFLFQFQFNFFQFNYFSVPIQFLSVKCFQFEFHLQSFNCFSIAAPIHITKVKGPKKQQFHVMHLKELTQTNQLHLQSAICHTVPHTVVAIVQGKTVSVSCLFWYPLNQPELKQWTSGFVGNGNHRHSQTTRLD